MRNLKQHFLLDPSVTSFSIMVPLAQRQSLFSKNINAGSVNWRINLLNSSDRRITGLLAESRTVLGEYLGTQAENLVYTQSVTISLYIVGRSLELGPGDEVLTTDHEYGAMDRTWRFLSKERGFRYIDQHIEMQITTDEKFIEDFWRGVTSRTRVIFISHITSPTAIIFPVSPFS